MRGDRICDLPDPEEPQPEGADFPRAAIRHDRVGGFRAGGDESAGGEPGPDSFSPAGRFGIGGRERDPAPGKGSAGTGRRPENRRHCFRRERRCGAFAGTANAAGELQRADRPERKRPERRAAAGGGAAAGGCQRRDRRDQRREDQRRRATARFRRGAARERTENRNTDRAGRAGDGRNRAGLSLHRTEIFRRGDRAREYFR